MVDVRRKWRIVVGAKPNPVFPRFGDFPRAVLTRCRLSAAGCAVCWQAVSGNTQLLSDPVAVDSRHDPRFDGGCRFQSEQTQPRSD